MRLEGEDSKGGGRGGIHTWPSIRKKKSREEEKEIDTRGGGEGRIKIKKKEKKVIDQDRPGSHQNQPLKKKK